jgi:glycosyltransferase involved in cell wall biosynthesis
LADSADCYYGLEGMPIEIDGLKIYPRMGDTWGIDAMIHHSADFNADAVFTMMDIWVLDPVLLSKVKNFIPYVPIDHDPPPHHVLDRLRYAFKIITFSKFGQRVLEKEGFTSTCIPESTNVNVFKPMDKKEARAFIKVPDDIFLFGMVGANKDNPPRKSFQEAIDAFKIFHDKHPKSGLFIHTLLQQAGGFPILDYIKYLGLENCFYALPDYQVLYKSDHPVIAQEMNAFDVLLQPSQSEGFGLPIIEAQACGVPVITTDFTAQAELVIPEKTGLLTKIYQKRWTPLESYVATADIQDLYQQMEKIFEMLSKPNTIAKDCRDHIVENYNMDTNFEKYWIPIIEQLQLDILGQPAQPRIDKPKRKH